MEKWRCISAMPLQFGDQDSWQARTQANIPAGDRERPAQLLENVKRRSETVAERYRERLATLYGKELAQTVRYAEAFQLSQSGRQASIDELKNLFPKPR